MQDGTYQVNAKLADLDLDWQGKAYISLMIHARSGHPFTRW